MASPLTLPILWWPRERLYRLFFFKFLVQKGAARYFTIGWMGYPTPAFKKKKSSSLSHLPAKLDRPGGQGVGQASCSNTGMDTCRRGKVLDQEIKGGGLGLLVDEFSFL